MLDFLLMHVLGSVEEGDEFLPLFERIEKEKERRREKNAALDRASAAASGGDPSGSSNLDPSK